MNKNEIKTAIEKASVLGDYYALAQKLTLEQAEEITEALETVKELFGITMRDQCFLDIIKRKVEKAKGDSE